MSGNTAALRAVSLAIYALFILGLALLFWDSFAAARAGLAAKARLKALRKDMDGAPSAPRGAAALTDMVSLAFGLKGENSGLIFIAGSLGLGLTVFILLAVSYGAALALYGFLAAAAIPYILMKARLQDLRVDMSREGEQLLTELLNNYRIGHYNMREAIERTAVTIEEAPISRRMLLDLSREMNAATGDEEVKRAIERFRLALSTSWGDLLAANLEFAELDGIRVTESLKDLAEGVSDARRLLEQTRRETSDSGMVLKVLFPVMCILIYLGATAAFGLTPAEFIHNQFGTPTGVGWAIGLLLSYALSLLASAYVSRQKMDI